LRTNKLYIPLGVLVLSVLVSFTSYSQDESFGRIQPLTKVIVKTNFRVPFSTSNIFFNENAQGVVQMSGSLNYSFAKNFYVGAGYDYTYFKLSEQQLNSSPNEQLDGKIQLQGFFGEMSYFYSLYDNVLFEANIQIGQETIRSSSAKCSEMGISHTKRGLFWNPNINAYLLTEEAFSFFFSVGYRISTKGFEPKDVCETEFSGHDSDDYQGNYGSIHVGFGIGFSFIKPERN